MMMTMMTMLIMLVIARVRQRGCRIAMQDITFAVKVTAVKYMNLISYCQSLTLTSERRDMLVPRTRTELGRRSFSVAAPTVWNSLPAYLHSTLIGRRQFRDGLKSHLFADAYF